jgi:HAMP domain-containing protein
MAVMARESWTDERLDDLKEHMDAGFGDVKAEIRETKAEIREVKGEVRDLRASMDAKFDRLTYTLIAALIGLLATHYLG